MSRRIFTPDRSELGFSMMVPDGFVQSELPGEEIDFDSPTQSAPLALFSSHEAMALIAVAARPAYETGSVLQWIRFLAEHFEMELDQVEPSYVGDGDCHPAITANATQAVEGQSRRVALVAFEDGGWFFTAHAMCPDDHWSRHGAALRAAVRSITLATPKGQTHDLDSTHAPGWKRISPEEYLASSRKQAREREQGRKPAVAQAEKLLREGNFDEAERAITRVDSSIEGGVEIARMYERRLRQLVEAGEHVADRERAEEIFGRALRWAQSCYPDPHTQIEADDFAAGQAEDRARLVAVLGWEPRLK